jgi:plastocyanin
MRLTKLIVLLVVASLALAACSSNKKTATNTTATTLGTTSTSSTSAYSSGGATSTTSAPAAGTSPSMSVVASDFNFAPVILFVKSGSSVSLTFKNAGTVEHNFSITSLKVSQDAGTGETKTVTFTAPTANGDVEFFCKYHKASHNMVGKLHVAAA